MVVSRSDLPSGDVVTEAVWPPSVESSFAWVPPDADCDQTATGDRVPCAVNTTPDPSGVQSTEVTVPAVVSREKVFCPRSYIQTSVLRFSATTAATRRSSG